MLHLYLPCFFWLSLDLIVDFPPPRLLRVSSSPSHSPRGANFCGFELRKCFLSPEVSTLGHADSCRLEVEWQPLTAAMAVGGCSPARGLCGPAQGLCSLVWATRHWGPVQELFWESCRKEMEEDVPPVVLGKSTGYQNPNKLKRQVRAR